MPYAIYEKRDGQSAQRMKNLGIFKDYQDAQKEIVRIAKCDIEKHDAQFTYDHVNNGYWLNGSILSAEEIEKLESWRYDVYSYEIKEYEEEE